MKLFHADLRAKGPAGRGPLLIILLIGAVQQAAGAQAPADFLSVQPKLSETPQYDSDPTLLPGAGKPLFGTVTTPEVTLASTLPDQQLSLDTRVNLNEFNLAPLNSNDVHSVLRATLSGQQWQFGLTGALDHDTTRTSEETSSGATLAGLGHFGVSLAPQIAWSFSAADTALLGGSVASSLYSSPIYTNYRDYSLSPTYQHAFTPLTTAEAVLQLSRYQTTTGYRLIVDQISPMAGIIQTLTPQMKATVLVGVERSYWTYPPGPQPGPGAQWGAAFNIDFSYRTQQDVLHVTASRQPNPTGLGTQAETTAVGITDSYFIRPDLQLDLTGQYQSSSYGALQVSTQRYYANASAQLTWHATPTLDVALSYRYRTQAFTDISTVPVSHGVALSFVYTGTPYSLR